MHEHLVNYPSPIQLFIKAVDALTEQDITQVKIAQKIGVPNPTAFSRLKEGRKSDQEYIELLKTLETTFSTFIKYNSDRDDYDRKKQKAVSDSVPYLPNLPYDTITNAIQKSGGRRRVRIIDTWMPFIENDGIKLLNDWVSNTSERFQILLLDPLSEGLRLRVKGLPRKSLYDAQLGLLQNLDTILNAQAENKKTGCKVEIKIYDHLPSLNVYLLDDDTSFSGNFLHGGFSQNNFFLRAEGKDSPIRNQISVHFDSLWDHPDTKEVDATLLAMLRNRVTRKVEAIHRLSQCYNLYHLSQGDLGNLQVSTLEIEDQEAGLCKLTIQLGGTQPEIHKGKIKVVGEGNLLFIFHSGRFFLEILTCPPNIDKPALLQAIFIRSNDRLLPFGAFAFLEAVESQQLKPPARYTASKNPTKIERYLLEKKYGTLSYEMPKSDVSQLTLPETTAEQNMLHDFAAAGIWSVYYPELYINEKNELAHHVYLNMIGQGNLQIQKLPNSSGYKSILNTKAIPVLEGEAKVSDAANAFYLNCSFMVSNRPRILLNLIIRLGARDVGNNLDGVFNVVYQNGRLGAGLVSLRRGETPQLQYLHPIRDSLPNLHPFLGFKRDSAVVWNDGRHQQHPYAGVYEVLVYGRQRNKEGLETKCIVRTMLRIHGNSYVEFKGVDPHGLADGRILANRILGNLYIELKNTASERRGYFIVAVKEEERPNKADIFGGVFSGLSAIGSLPLGKRCIMRYLGNGEEEIQKFAVYEKGDKLLIFSEEYQELEPAIRDALTGRLTNFVGFQSLGRVFINQNQLREANEKELPLAKMFLESAIYRAIIETESYRLEDILEPLRQSLIHGLDTFETFEKRISGSKKEVDILSHNRYIDLKKLLKS